MAHGDGAFTDIPDALAIRAQRDLNFALRLLHRASREDAIGEADLDLTEVQKGALNARLDEMADLSFPEALERLRNEGWNALP